MQRRRRTSISLALIIIGVILIIISLMGLPDQIASAKYPGALDRKAESLAALALESGVSAPTEDGFTVWFSVSNGRSRARVAGGSGDTLEKAWDTALSAAEKLVSSALIEPVWVKADVLTEAKPVTAAELKELSGEYKSGYLRRGVAFGSLDNALMEAEVNFAGVFDYEAGAFNEAALYAYLAETGRQPSGLDGMELLTCRSWFCGEDGMSYALDDNGMREMDASLSETAEAMLGTVSAKLGSMVQSDGSFIYGWQLSDGHEFTGYNVVRHCGAAWSMIKMYERGNESLAGAIKKAVGYVAKNCVTYRDDGAAFIVEEKSDELKLGAGALAAAMFTEYEKAFGGGQYTELAERLGDGMLAMRLPEGGFYHVWNTDFSEKERDRTVYYDGEATFALTLLYGMDGDEKWLSAAKDAADWLISSGYEQYGDHWVSYAINELTKYAPEEKYFEFALKNVSGNLEDARTRVTAGFTDFEMLGAARALISRMQSGNLFPELLQGFDTAALDDAADLRAGYMETAYGWPEYAMYFGDPQAALGGVYAREDGARMRIDDLQHFACGYMLYLDGDMEY